MRITFLLFTLLVVTCSFGYSQDNHRGVRYASGENESAVPQCLSENLSVREGETDAAMGGVRATEFLVTNKGAAPCTLKGYPRVALLNKKGIVVRKVTRQTSDGVAATSVTLEPGKDAAFNIIHNAGGAGYTGKPCPSYPKIRITLPGTTRAVVLSTDIVSCAKTAVQVSSLFEPTPE